MKRFALILCTVLLCSSVQPRKDIMDRVFITPERVVWTSGNVTNAEAILEEDNGQSNLIGHNSCYLETAQTDTASIILDFGKELHGGLKLTMGGRERYPKLVRIRFGESVTETCSTPCDTDWLMGYSTDDHAMRDYTIKIPRDGSIEIGNTGFRFVRIDLLERNVRLDLREASAILRYRDIPYKGSFKCSDPLLDTIWTTGAWTVQLNMQEYLWDGIKRDRMIWLGDMHPEVSTIRTVFGHNDVVERSIDLASEQYPLPGWFNGMSAYSMWYLIIHYDWYMQNGNKAFLEKHKDYITGLVDQIDEKVAEDGTENLAFSRFLDWPSSPNQKGVEAGYRALLCIALDDAAKLCDILGDPAHAQKCHEIHARLEKLVKPHNDLKQAAALMALADLMPAKQACDEVVSVGGGAGFSTFYGYYMLEALAKAGEYQTAIDIIREFWGGMINLGATSFWEDFNLEWTKNASRIDEFPAEGKDDIHGDFGAYCYPSFRHSLCHGWSSGPTAWMSAHILGVEILAPGCRKVRVTPHLGDLQWAEGTYPTPRGEIKIRAERKPNGKIKTKVRAPFGVRVVKK